MNHVTHLLTSADISIFSPEISKFIYIKKYRYKLHFSILAFFESLKVCLINLVIILMMQAKVTTLGLPKITVFWSKGYEVIISVNNVTNKILSHDSNYVVDVFMWPTFGNCSVSMRKQPQFYKDLSRKTAFFEGSSSFNVNNLRLVLGTN